MRSSTLLHGAGPQRTFPRFARESGSGYVTDPLPWDQVPHPADTPPASLGAVRSPPGPRADQLGPPPEPSLRDAVQQARWWLDQIRELAASAAVGGGELGGLVDLIAAVDTGQAAMTTLSARIQRHRLAPRTTGLTLDAFLACQAALPDGDRRRLLRSADTLRAMPRLAEAVRAGQVGGATLAGIVSEAGRLRAEARARLDAMFGDTDRLGQLGPEEQLDAVRDAVRSLAGDDAGRDERQAVEHRFLAVQPRLDGALTGYFELDAEGGATLLDALDAAAPPPSSGPQDVSTHARDDDPASPATPANWPRRRRGRQRADGLVTLAETYLGAPLAADTPRRARPRLLVLADLATLTGDDEHAAAARLLWAVQGGPARLTPEAVRRLASDADLRLILHDDGEVLGTTAPTSTISRAVRDAVIARDQGCRFPGCRAPAAWTDLHHVVAREHGGPTTPANLAALCRRHHTAVTTGGWRLTMTPDAIVTVRRGRRVATGLPPHRRRLRTDPPED